MDVVKDIPVPRALGTCVPTVYADELSNHILEVYHIYPLCKMSGQVDVLRLFN